MPGRQPQGFTLIELLVALAIMALLALLSWRGLDGMARAQEGVQSRMDDIVAIQTGLAQWTADLDAVVETPQVSAIDYDGRVLRLTRRDSSATDSPLRVVGWARRVIDSQHGGRGSWARWQSPPLRTRAELQEAWARVQLWAQNASDAEKRREVAVAGLEQWQVFYFRNDGWSNPLSTAGAASTAAAAAPAPTPAPAGAVPLPDGVRIVLGLSPGQALTGTLTKDWIRPILGGGKKLSSLHSRQRGAALLAAMLTVALVASFAATALWQQWRAVEVESAERSRVQAAWILTGALDWARLILREDARSGGADYLAEPWAVPLQEARLSSFLAADKNNSSADVTDNQLEVFLSGQIEDMQSRLNVLNLLDAGAISAPDLRAFARLFDLLGLPQAELLRLAENLRFAGDTSPDNRSGAFASLMPQRLDQLAWLGLPVSSIARLAPYVALLPARTAVNLNTASAEVIYASIPGLEMAQARKLVDERARSHFRNLDEAGRQIGDIAGRINEGRHSVATRFFEVRGRLRMERTLIEERSLVQRDGLDVKTLWRERAALGPQSLQ